MKNIPPSESDNSSQSQTTDVSINYYDEPTLRPALPPATLQARQQRYERDAMKRRRATLTYALVCGGGIVLFLLLFFSSMGAFAGLFLKTQKVQISSDTSAGLSAATQDQATPVTIATPTAASNTGIGFTPVAGPSPTQAVAGKPATTPTPGITPTPGMTPTPTPGVTPTSTLGITPTPTPGITPTPTSPPGGSALVTPLASCVIALPNGSFTAYFGYANASGSTLTLPIGPNNRFVGVPANQHQPTSFSTGNQRLAVAVHSRGQAVSWILDGGVATAIANSVPCF